MHKIMQFFSEFTLYLELTISRLLNERILIFAWSQICARSDLKYRINLFVFVKSFKKTIAYIFLPQ